MKKNGKFWRGKRLAHIFDDGWDEGTFQGREKKHLIFLYHPPGGSFKYAHSLDLDEHGVSNSWVITKRV